MITDNLHFTMWIVLKDEVSLHIQTCLLQFGLRYLVHSRGDYINSKGYCVSYVTPPVKSRLIPIERKTGFCRASFLYRPTVSQLRMCHRGYVTIRLPFATLHNQCFMYWLRKTLQMVNWILKNTNNLIW